MLLLIASSPERYTRAAAGRPLRDRRAHGHQRPVDHPAWAAARSAPLAGGLLLWRNAQLARVAIQLCRGAGAADGSAGGPASARRGGAGPGRRHRPAGGALPRRVSAAAAVLLRPACKASRAITASRCSRSRLRTGRGAQGGDSLRNRLACGGEVRQRVVRPYAVMPYVRSCSWWPGASGGRRC